jgi:hypothetical protein
VALGISAIATAALAAKSLEEILEQPSGRVVIQAP